jgi:hypothetical protein
LNKNCHTIKTSFEEDNENDNETSKSNEEDSNNNKKSPAHLLTTSNDFFKWSDEDDNANDEKIYEELCYVTISSTFPSEVLIPLNNSLIHCMMNDVCVLVVNFMDLSNVIKISI